MEWNGLTWWVWSSLRIHNPLRSEGGGLCSLLYVEGLLMPWLGELIWSFSHPSLLDEEAAALLHSVFTSVLFSFHPFISKSWPKLPCICHIRCPSKDDYKAQKSSSMKMWVLVPVGPHHILISTFYRQSYSLISLVTQGNYSTLTECGVKTLS